MNTKAKDEYLAKTDLIRSTYISKKESIETSSQLNDQAKQKRLLQHKIQHNEILQKLRDEYRSGRVSRKGELEKKLFSISYKPSDDKTAIQMSWRDAINKASVAAAADNADKDSAALSQLLSTANLSEDELLQKAVAVTAREFNFNSLALAALGEKQAPLYQELLALEDSLSNPTSAEMFDESSIFAPVEYLSALDMSQDAEPAAPELPSQATGRATNSITR